MTTDTPSPLATYWQQQRALMTDIVTNAPKVEVSDEKRYVRKRK